jgi:peptidoglycan/LPS O-acetylase OafA/YrhL
VYPAYWAVLLVLIPVYFIVPGLGDGSQTKPLQILTSIFLLPYPQDPILTVGWTLKYEILFYVLFGLWIADRRLGSAVLIIWQVACLAALGFGDLDFPLGFFLSPNNLLFGLGMAVAYLTATNRIAFPMLLAVFGIAMFVAVGLHQVYAAGKFSASAYILLFGAGSAIAVLGLASLERIRKVPVPKLLAHLGDASYATYLVHFPLLSVLAKVLFASGLAYTLPEWLLFIALFGSALAAGSIFHLLIERPAMAMLRGR